MDKSNNIFGERLKQFRKSLNLTQKEFVKNISLTSAALSNYESGQKNPSIKVAREIALEHKISVDWLLGLSDNLDDDHSPTTYSDVIKLLFALDKAISLDIKIVQFEDYETEVRFTIDNNILRIFVKSWTKIKALKDDGSIDSDLYDLWMERELEKYDKFLSLKIQNNQDDFANDTLDISSDDLPF